MRFALLTTAAALLAGASAQAAAGSDGGAAAMMVAGIDKLAGMADGATAVVRSVGRGNLGDTGPLVVGMLTNIADEMETQAGGLSPPSSPSSEEESKAAAAMTPFSDEEQQGVCDAFGHMAESGDNLLSGLMTIRSLLEGTQFMEPVGVMISRWGPSFNTLFGAFMQFASNCAEETVQAAPDVGTRLAEAIGVFTGNEDVPEGRS